MLHTYPGINPGKLSQHQFSELLQQAFNITGWKVTGKLELETEKDKVTRAREEFKKLNI